MLAGATLGVWSPVLRNGFVNYDDPQYVTANPALAGGLSWASVRWAFTSEELSYRHPLTWLSHALDVSLYGLNPAGHHFTSLLLHALAAALLFLFLDRATARRGCSLLVAALFAVHPLHVESVAWVAERKDVLSGLCAMATLLLWDRYARAPSPARYLAAAAAFGAGLLSKPMLVTLPLGLLALDYWPLGRWTGGPPPASGRPIPRRGAGRLLVEKVPLGLLAAATAAMTLRVERARGAVPPEEAAYPLALRVANALASPFAYLAKTVWPVRLAVLYPMPDAIPPGIVIAAAAGLVAVTVVALRGARGRPWLAVGWVWYLAGLAPVLGLVQVGEKSHADRYVYLPLLGVLVISAWGGADVLGVLLKRLSPAPARTGGEPQRHPPSHAVARVGIAASCLAVAACAALTVRQAGTWRDSETLWKHTLDVTGDGNETAHYDLGNTLLAAGRLDEAIAEFQRACAIRPWHAEAQCNLGIALERAGRVGEAEGRYAEAARLAPALAEPRQSLVILLLKEGRPAEAVPHAEALVTLRPDDAEAVNDLALALTLSGRRTEATPVYRRALALARRRNPLLGFAWLLATAPEDALRRGEDAVRLAQEACAMPPGGTAEALEVLAAAQAESGGSGEAVATAERAEGLARARGEAALADRLAGEAVSYRKGLPMRDGPPDPSSQRSRRPG